MDTANKSTQTETALEDWKFTPLWLLIMMMMATWDDKDRVKHFAAAPEFPEVAGDCLRGLLHNLNADRKSMQDEYGVSPFDNGGNLKSLEQVFQELNEKEINWQEMEDGK